MVVGQKGKKNRDRTAPPAAVPLAAQRPGAGLRAGDGKARDSRPGPLDLLAVDDFFGVFVDGPRFFLVSFGHGR
ncbi:MAG: hypothetical protein JWP75_4167 [Frondihabitans sp.]|nr:hypothetical protein [Frondihabitans sp.]